MRKKFYFFLAFTVLSLLVNAAVPPGTLIFNSDGLGHGVSVPSNPMQSGLIMRGYGPATGMTQWPTGYSKTTIVGGIYDGNGNIWLIPGGPANYVIKVNVTNGQMTGYNDWPAGLVGGGMSFRGGVLDDDGYIWMLPCNANMVVRINTVNGQMTGYNGWPSGFTRGTWAFVGGVNSGDGYIWLVACDANMILRINTSSSNGTIGTMTGYNSWPAGFTKSTSAFCGGILDSNGYMWIVPHDADRVIKVNTNSANGTIGAMTGYNSWPVGFTKGPAAFYGGINSGDGFVWMVSRDADMVISINTSNGAMTGYTFTSGNYGTGMAGFTKGAQAFIGGLFDGQYLWMTPMDADRIVRVNTQIGGTLGQMEGLEFVPGNYAQGMTGYTKGGSAFCSGVSDGRSVWLVPYMADRLIRFGPVLVTPPVNTTIDTTTAFLNQAYFGTITANVGCSLPVDVTVTVGGVPLATGNFTYNSSTGAFTIINGANVTGDIVISGIYTVTNNITNTTPTSPPNATQDIAYSLTLVADAGYGLPMSITMTRNGSSFTAFTYNNTTGLITIAAAEITGNFVINGAVTEYLEICDSTCWKFIATATNGEAYQWQVNGIDKGTNDSIFIYCPKNKDTVICLLLSGDCSISDTVISNVIIITAKPRADSIHIQTQDTVPTCSNVPLTLNVTASSLLFPTPVFRWYDSQTSDIILHTGQSYTPSPALVVSRSYFVSVEDLSGNPCENLKGHRKEIHVKVTPSVTPTIKIKARVNY